MNTISLGPNRDPGTSGQDLAKVYGRLRSCSVLFIGADNACAALGGRARQAFTQAITCSTEIFSFVFIAKPPGLCTDPHIHDSARETLTILLDIPLDCGADRSNRGGLQIYLDHLLGICATLSNQCPLRWAAKLCNRITAKIPQPARFAKKLGRVFLTRTPQMIRPPRHRRLTLRRAKESPAALVARIWKIPGFRTAPITEPDGFACRAQTLSASFMFFEYSSSSRRFSSRGVSACRNRA